MVLPNLTGVFQESPTPVLMPESFLIDLLRQVSEHRLRFRSRYCRTSEGGPTERAWLKSELLLHFFANRAPLGFLQDFLFALQRYEGDDDWMVRLKGALDQLLLENQETPGRFLGQDMQLLEALLSGHPDPELTQVLSSWSSLIAQYFLGPALLWRLRRDHLLTERDEQILDDLAVAGSVDPASNDLLTQIIRLRTVPWRERLVVRRLHPDGSESKRTLLVLDLVIELLWGDLRQVPPMLAGLVEEGDTPETLRRRLRGILREVASLDVAAAHVLNPGFAAHPVRGILVALVRCVGRDGVNSLVLVTLRGDRVLRWSLVPAHIHPSVEELRLHTDSSDPRSIEEMERPWHNLEDARLDLFRDPKDDRYKLNLAYVVADGGPIPLLESMTLDVDSLLSLLDQVPVRDLEEAPLAQASPHDVRHLVTQLANSVVKRRRERQRKSGAGVGPGGNGIVATQPVHPLLIPENREALLSLGLPPEVYGDPEACVKDASRTRVWLPFGDEIREVDVWEFRSKKGGQALAKAPLYAGRYLNPEPSWIGRVALDAETSRIVAVPVMPVGGEWRFRPYLISEDRFCWIGGSSQRGVEEMVVWNPVTQRKETILVGLNVIHTTEEVPVESLPYWLQPTRPDPRVPLWKYELRVTFELNHLDPFAEPLLYEGVIATPRRLDDWVGWVGRVKFNNNFTVRSLTLQGRPDSDQEEQRVMEILMAGGDHVVQHAWGFFSSLTPLQLPWNSLGRLILPPPTPFIDPQTGKLYNEPVDG